MLIVIDDGWDGSKPNLDDQDQSRRIGIPRCFVSIPSNDDMKEKGGELTRYIDYPSGIDVFHSSATATHTHGVDRMDDGQEGSNGTRDK